MCSELVQTGANFIPRSVTKRVRFIRVTYVRPIIHRGHEHHLHVGELPVAPIPRQSLQVSGALIVAPLPGLAYRTFTPAPVKVAMCSGQPEYESFSSMWQRSRAWLNAVSKYAPSLLVPQKEIRPPADNTSWTREPNIALDTNTPNAVYEWRITTVVKLEETRI